MSRLLVVGYHNVAPTWFWPDAPGRGIDGLVAQVRALMRLAPVVRLSDALRDLAAGRPLPPRAVALTFDDGYRDNLTLAAPALARLGAPATFFLVPGFLDRTVDAWWEVLAWAVARGEGEAEVRGHRIVAGDPHRPEVAAFAEDVKSAPRAVREAAVAELAERLGARGGVGTDRLFMDWDEARRLPPGIEVGSHTPAHEILARETAGDQAAGLAAARRRLQDELAAQVDLLAYPNGGPGDFDDVTIAAARDAGHTAAVTTIPGWVEPGSPPFALDRVVLDPATGLRGLRAVMRTPGFLKFLSGR